MRILAGNKSPTIRSVALAAVIAAVLSSCGGSLPFSIGGETVEDVAVELIEGELAEILEVELTATCPPVEDPEIGTEFACTALTADGDVVNFEGVVDREDHINVASTNAVRGEVLTEFELAAGELLTEQVGVPVTVECGDGLGVLDAQQELDCEAADASDTRAAKLKITDAETGSFSIRLV